MKVLINAIHTKVGGGLTYLNKVLPYIAADKSLEITLFCHKNYRDQVEIPENVVVKEQEYPDNFFITLIWEQFILPFKGKFDATLNIANYMPLFAKNSIPLLTNTPPPKEKIKGVFEKLYWFFLGVMTRFSVFNAPIVLANGQEIAKLFAKQHLNKVIQAPNGCDLPESVNKTRKKGQILAIGDIYPHKDYSTLIEAFDKLREELDEVSLIIAGRPLNVEEARKIEALIEDKGLGGAVKLVGRLPYEEAMKTLGESELYVSTSRAETYSATVLEAMAYGTPVVVGDFDFQWEVAGRSAVYVPLDKGGDVAAALATAMLGILSNPSIAKSLSRAGLKEAQGKSWEATAKNIIEALKKAGLKPSSSKLEGVVEKQG